MLDTENYSFKDFLTQITRSCRGFSYFINKTWWVKKNPPLPIESLGGFESSFTYMAITAS